MLTTAPTDRIARISLDEATIIARNADIECEREVALHDLVQDNEFRPQRAMANGHKGPWDLHLAVIDAQSGETSYLRRDAGIYSRPLWSPEGDWLLI